MIYRVPLVLSPQPEGGFTVTSPALPELISEGDTSEEALDNVRDALEAVLEIYRELNRPLPSGVVLTSTTAPVNLDTLITVS
jgi:antitoxin HicB